MPNRRSNFRWVPLRLIHPTPTVCVGWVQCNGTHHSGTPDYGAFQKPPPPCPVRNCGYRRTPSSERDRAVSGILERRFFFGRSLTSFMSLMSSVFWKAPCGGTHAVPWARSLGLAGQRAPPRTCGFARNRADVDEPPTRVKHANPPPKKAASLSMTLSTCPSLFGVARMERELSDILGRRADHADSSGSQSPFSRSRCEQRAGPVCCLMPPSPSRSVAAFPVGWRWFNSEAAGRGDASLGLSTSAVRLTSQPCLC